MTKLRSYEEEVSYTKLLASQNYNFIFDLIYRSRKSSKLSGLKYLIRSFLADGRTTYAYNYYVINLDTGISGREKTTKLTHN